MFRSMRLLAVLTLLSTPALPHDFWVRPEVYTLDEPGPVAVRLLVGDDFDGKAYPRDPAHLQRFVVAGPDGITDVPGERGMDPAGTAELPHPGLHVVGYRSHGSVLRMEPRDFEAYLAHEGLDAISRLRAEAGLTDTAGREVFSRCAKAIVRVGDDAAQGFDRRLDLALELVPENDPTRLGADGRLTMRLLLDGQPLAGALVTAHHREKVALDLPARTDEEGRAVFNLPHDGEWMLNTVHMQPAPLDIDADWESLWASLTFGATRDETTMGVEG